MTPSRYMRQVSDAGLLPLSIAIPKRCHELAGEVRLNTLAMRKFHFLEISYLHIFI